MPNLRWRIAQWLELKWWKRYLKPKHPDKYLAWKRQYWYDFLHQLSGYLPLQTPNSSKVINALDAGCGPAGIFTALPANNWAVTAIDPLLNKYANELPHFNPNQWPNVRFETNTIENMQYEACFEVVFCLNAINHVTNIDNAVDKLVQSLQPNGCLVMSIDAHNYRFWRWLFRKIPADVLHPHQYNLKEYQNLLSQRGIILKASVLLQKNYFFNYYFLVGYKTAN